MDTNRDFTPSGLCVVGPYTAHYWAATPDEARTMWHAHFGTKPTRKITMVRELP